jgi:hypothetical protein
VEDSPVGSLEPIVTFSTTMAINDSTNSNYDDFLWQMFDSKGRALFSIDFSNANLQIYYRMDGSSARIPTGVQFANSTALALVVTMDYSTNKWSATLNGSNLILNQPIHRGADLLDFGYMAATWQVDVPGSPGNNFMVFDNYSIIAGQNPQPKISFQPQSASVVTGNSATLGVVATGEAPLYYQWFDNKQAIAGAIDSSLTIPNVQPSNAGKYTVEVSNAAGLVTSTAATLTVTPEPVIATIKNEPASITVAAGSTAVFQTAATGYPAPTYQWYDNGNPILHGTKPVLSIPKAQVGNDGNYTVVASNSVGSGTSTPAAVLTVGKSFLSQAGLFNGMIFNGASDLTGSGELKVTLGAAGTFTGSVSLAGITYRMAGTFNPEGSWTGVVGRGIGFLPIVVNLQLALSGTNEITGTVTIGSTVETSTALRDNFVKTTNPALEAGAYTMTLTSTSASMPQGIGYAAITIDKLGNVKAAGKLGDNTAFSVAGVLSDSGTWPFYIPLYSEGGYIGGTVTFSGATGAGTLYWTRPATSSFGGYAAGFSGTVTAAAYSYTPPVAKTPVIPLGASHTGTINFTGNVINPPITGGLTLSPAGALLSSNTSIKLTLSPTTGIFSGTVSGSDLAKPATFSGAIIQSQDGGFGLFQTLTVSGEVQITSP